MTGSFSELTSNAHAGLVSDFDSSSVPFKTPFSVTLPSSSADLCARLCAQACSTRDRGQRALGSPTTTGLAVFSVLATIQPEEIPTCNAEVSVEDVNLVSGPIRDTSMFSVLYVE